MRFKFWGVRGSIPTPSLQNMGTGGNTTCLELRSPTGEVLIIDGGTGIRPLGAALAGESAGKPANLHVFLTHFHWDHIQGFPFFLPLYGKDNSVTFYSIKPVEETSDILEGQMNRPYFPVDFAFLPAKRSFVQVSDEVLQFGEVEVRNFPLHHPQGCRGYSFTHRGRKLVFASDFEHGVAAFDQIVLEAAQDAEVLVFDAQFTPEEYPTRRGWGHSTWLQATEVAKQAGVKRLYLFHHDPGHDDELLQKIVDEARTHFPETYAAVEGEEFFV
jgi:phosphoribosyl 1,2-cyclic phosphodiesterase